MYTIYYKIGHKTMDSKKSYGFNNQNERTQMSSDLF